MGRDHRAVRRPSLGEASSYLVTGGVTSLVATTLLGVNLLVAAASTVGIGVPLLPHAATATRVFLAGERRRIGALLDSPVPEQYRPVSGSPWDRLRSVLRDAATYRDLIWLTAHGGTGMVLASIVVALWSAVALGILAPLMLWLAPGEYVSVGIPINTWARALPFPLLVAPAALAALRWLVPGVALGHAHIARRLLAPSARTILTARVTQLSATRAAALDAHAAELRRVERDLHDGVQARLVTTGIQLALAQRQREVDAGSADRLVAQARKGVDDALSELQQIVRGVYPPILADRGLAGALDALAAECPVPVAKSITVTERLPAALETAAYFIAAEALTNVAKHSTASTAQIRVDHHAGALTVAVTDDGRGGADESRGTGLVGMRHRAEALDGQFMLTSPPGGPTRIQVRIPCG